MSSIMSPPSFRALGRRETWLGVCAYLLFVFSTFSIAGVDAAVILLYFAVLYHRLRQPVAERLPRWLVVAFLMLPAVAIVSAVANGVEAPLPGGDSAPSVLSNLAALRGLFRIVLPLALLPALGQVKLRNLLLTLLLCTGMMALYATIQFRWGVDWFRPEGRKLSTAYFWTKGIFQGVYHGKGNFSHHLTFAGVMLMLVPLSASLAWAHAGRMRLAWGAGAVLAGLGVLVTLSRSGWLGVGVGLLLLWLRFPRRLLLPLATVAVLFGLAGALFGTGWLAQFASPARPPLVKRLLTISLGENRERLYLWESALMGIRDRPLLGTGYGNDKYYAPAYRTDIAARRNFTFLIGLKTHMHNVYLQLGFELGLVGLAAYLLWWGAILRWNRMWLLRAGSGFLFERALLYGASGGLAGSMAAGFFENNFFDAEVQTMSMILMGLSLHAGLMIRAGHRQGLSA